MKKLMILFAMILISCSSPTEEKPVVEIPDYSDMFIPISVGNKWNYIGELIMPIMFFPPVSIDTVVYAKTELFSTSEILGYYWWYLTKNSTGGHDFYRYNNKGELLQGFFGYSDTGYLLVTTENEEIKYSEDAFNIDGTTLNYIKTEDIIVGDSLYKNCRMYSRNYSHLAMDTLHYWFKDGIGIVKAYAYYMSASDKKKYRTSIYLGSYTVK